MSLQAQPIPPIPELTVRIARAAFRVLATVRAGAGSAALGFRRNGLRYGRFR